MDKIKDVVNSVSSPKEWMGKLQIGFTLKSDPKKWYNLAGEEKELIQITKHIVSKGNLIEFDIDQGNITNLTMKEKAKEEEKNWVDSMVNLEKLLDAAHTKGLQRVEIIKRETKFDEKNIPIQSTSEVRVTMKDGSIFEGTGDADTNNTTDMTEDAIIRMGETRGLVRALRWATNESKAATEEKK